MLELKTNGRLVHYEALEDGGGLTAVLDRDELAAAFETGDAAQLWFDVEGGESDLPTRLTIELAPDDLEAILRQSHEDEIALAIDADAFLASLEDPDVEAHGLRGGLAVAVASAAILAPAGMAAVPQTVEPAAMAQRVTPAATSQGVAPAAATRQVTSSLVVRAQLSRSLRAQSQATRSLVLRAQGLTLLRGGLAR